MFTAGVIVTGRGDMNIGKKYPMHERSGNIELYQEFLRVNA